MKSCAAAAASLMRADKTSGSIVFVAAAAELPDVSQCRPPEFLRSSPRAAERPISAYFPSAERFFLLLLHLVFSGRLIPRIVFFPVLAVVSPRSQRVEVFDDVEIKCAQSSARALDQKARLFISCRTMSYRNSVVALYITLCGELEGRARLKTAVRNEFSARCLQGLL